MVTKHADRIKRQFRQHWEATLLLVAYLCLATIYSVVTPIWESYDEDGHYQYARYIATNAKLLQINDPSADVIWEKFQPPLYYVLAAVIMLPVDVSDNLVPIKNPYISSGKAGINYAIHSSAEQWPYHGTILAVHLVRLLSVVIGALAVLFTYLIGLLIAPKHREVAVVAMILHAFWPQFLFNSSVITNDVLAATMGSIVTYCLVRLMRYGPNYLRVLTLGVAFGLALSSKFNTIVLVPIATTILIFVLIQWLHGEAYRKYTQLLGMIALYILPILTACWLLSRMPYVKLPTLGDSSVLSVQNLMQTLKDLCANGGGAMVGQTLRYMVKTFYASFGWGNVEITQPYYYVALAMQTIAIIGGAIALLRRGDVNRSLLFLCGLICLSFAFEVVMLATIRRNAYMAPGRYLLPGISSYMVFLAVGFITLRAKIVNKGPQRFRMADPQKLCHFYKFSLWMGGAISFAVAIIIPFHFIQPAYTWPRSEKLLLSNIEHPALARFGNQLELIGYEVKPQVLQPGEWVDVVLYWRCLAQMKDNYTVAVQVLDADGITFGGVDSYPGQGNLATSLWRPGEIVQDGYHFQLSADFPPQYYAQIKVAMYHLETKNQIPITNAQSQLIGNEIHLGQFRVATQNGWLPETAMKAGASFGDCFTLLGYELPAMLHRGETETLTFFWQAVVPTDVNYTIFVHLVDAQGNIVIQDDSQPRSGRFPTALWAKGDIIQDAHTLTIPLTVPSGKYSLHVGFYRLDTMVRLSARDEMERTLADDQFVIKDLVVQ